MSVCVFTATDPYIITSIWYSCNVDVGKCLNASFNCPNLNPSPVSDASFDNISSLVGSSVTMVAAFKMPVTHLRRPGETQYVFLLCRDIRSNGATFSAYSLREFLAKLHIPRNPFICFDVIGKLRLTIPCVDHFRLPHILGSA